MSPALATKNFVACLTHFRFDGKTALAYNDVVALEVACDFPLKKCLPGDTLLSLLSSSRATEVELVEDEETHVSLKMGRSKVKLPSIPLNEYVYQPLREKPEGEVRVTDQFLSCMEAALLSVGTDPSAPYRLDVTMYVENLKSVHFYSSDVVTITRAILKTNVSGVKAGFSAILPRQFCTLLVDIGKKDSIKSFNLNTLNATVQFDSGLILTSRLLQGANQAEFEKVFSFHSKDITSLIDIPQQLQRCLDRALIVAGDREDRFTSIKITDKGKMLLETMSLKGQVHDRIALEGHDVVSVRADAKLISRVLPLVNRFHIGNCFVLTGPGLTHLISIMDSGE